MCKTSPFRDFGKRNNSAFAPALRPSSDGVIESLCEGASSANALWCLKASALRPFPPARRPRCILSICWRASAAVQRNSPTSDASAACATPPNTRSVSSPAARLPPLLLSTRVHASRSATPAKVSGVERVVGLCEELALMHRLVLRRRPSLCRRPLEVVILDFVLASCRLYR